MKRLVLMALLLVATPAGAQLFSRSPQATAESWVRENLRDPRSGEFRDVRTFAGNKADEDMSVCGLVRGRNAFNGISDWQRFVVVLQMNGQHWTLAGANIEGLDDAGFPALVRDYCYTGWYRRPW